MEHQALNQAAGLSELTEELIGQADFLPKKEPALVLEAHLALKQALKQANGRLLAGLIGGTGVGKSSLISALAGAKISAASAIRPTTDEPVIYRHRNHPVHLPGATAVLHELPGLADLALVDLPDFDSLKAAHAEKVLEILPRFDLLIWVTTPLKYADRRLYQMLKRAEQGLSKTAQVFILNKTDQLQNRYGPEQAPKVIDDLTADFKNYLSLEAGFSEPVVWALSALKAMAEPEELAPLRAFLARLSDLKTRKRIEEANLERKAEVLKTRLLEALPPKKLNQTAEKLKALVSQWPWPKRAAKTVALAQTLGSAFYADRRREITATAPAVFRPAFDLVDFFKSLAGRTPPEPSPASEIHPSPEIFSRPWAAAWEELRSAWPWPEPPPRLRPGLSQGQWPAPTQLRADFNLAAVQAFHRRLDGLPRPKAWPRWLSALPLLLIPLAVWAETIGRPLGPVAFTAALWRGLPPLLLLIPLAYLGLAYFNLYRQNKIFQRHYKEILACWGKDLVAQAETNLNQPVLETARDLEKMAGQLADL